MFIRQEYQFLSVIVSYFLTCTIQISFAQKHIFTSNEDCGIRDIIEGDALTEDPWVAAIFTVTKPSAPLKFAIAATIIGPSTVLTLFSGSYGNPPRGAPKDYHIYHPQNVFVAAGLNSTNLEAQTTENLQIVEVSYILPYNGHDQDNKHFHYYIYHLKTPFDFASPYVRAVCLPPPIDARFNDLPSKTFMQGGFSFPSLKQVAVATYPREIFNVTSIPEEQCAKAFRYYYRGTGSSHLFCARRSPGVVNSDRCFLHGSPVVFERDGRWMLAGITALIPGRKRGQCNKDTLYMYSKTFLHYDWMVKTMECGSRNFACERDDTCVPLSKVCNGLVDCPVDNSDEDPVFCDATFRCSDKENEVVCGLNGKCIRKTQLCNKKYDCEDGSDEHETRCNAPPKPTNQTFSRPKNSLQISTLSSNSSACYAIPPSEGVVKTCFSDIDDEKVQSVNCENAKIGSWMTLRCEDFYVSKYRIKSIQMQCQENGLWHPFKPFDCEANCGILSSNISPLISNGADATKNEAFPWHAALFKLTISETENQYRYICGASLIEKSELFTAGHCVGEIYTNPKAANLFKVVLAPVSSNYEENKNDPFAKIFDIKRVWVPPTFDSRSLNSDIAIIQLTNPTQYGSYIRPVCYLNSGTSQPHLQEIGKVAGFGRTETGEISPSLKYTSLPVVEKEKCVTDSATETIVPNTFCAGNNNETTLCQGDSGNGLVFGEKKASVIRYTLKGITSSGYGRQAKECGKNRFSVFTHVDALNNWIYEVLENFLD